MKGSNRPKHGKHGSGPVSSLLSFDSLFGIFFSFLRLTIKAKQILYVFTSTFLKSDYKGPDTIVSYLAILTNMSN